MDLKQAQEIVVGIVERPPTSPAVDPQVALQAIATVLVRNELLGKK